MSDRRCQQQTQRVWYVGMVGLKVAKGYLDLTKEAKVY